jgi:hypothetical protein
MFSFLSSIIQFFMYWVFMYVGSFLLLIVGIVWIIKTNPTPPTPIIHEHKIVQNIIQPTKRVLVEREVCNRVDGCPIVNNVCVDCITVKN